MISKEWFGQVMALPRELRIELADRLSLDWNQAEIAEDGAEKLTVEAEGFRELCAQVLRLPVTERKALAVALDDSLLAEDDWEKECIAIVEARLDRYDQGLDQAIPWEAVLAEMRQR
jgi:putative addiction module component (TIGR02574 family)